MAEATRTVQQLIEEGISAAKQNDLRQARRHLIAALSQDPQQAEAWLWLSGAVDTPAERRYCMQEVLRIEPNNRAAARGLSRLPPGSALSPLEEPLPENLPPPEEDLPWLQGLSADPLPPLPFENEPAPAPPPPLPTASAAEQALTAPPPSNVFSAPADPPKPAVRTDFDDLLAQLGGGDNLATTQPSNKNTPSQPMSSGLSPDNPVADWMEDFDRSIGKPSGPVALTNDLLAELSAASGKGDEDDFLAQLGRPSAPAAPSGDPFADLRPSAPAAPSDDPFAALRPPPSDDPFAALRPPPAAPMPPSPSAASSASLPNGAPNPAPKRGGLFSQLRNPAPTPALASPAVDPISQPRQSSNTSQGRRTDAPPEPIATHQFHLCPNCGQSVNSDVIYCANCGHDLVRNQPPPPPLEPTPAPAPYTPPQPPPLSGFNMALLDDPAPAPAAPQSSGGFNMALLDLPATAAEPAPAAKRSEQQEVVPVQPEKKQPLVRDSTLVMIGLGMILLAIAIILPLILTRLG